MTRQLHRRRNAAQRDTIRLAKSASVRYAPPRPAGKPNPLTRKENEDMPIDNPYIPIATIALELGEDLTQLAARLDGAVQLDGIGLRVVTRDVAAEVLAEHRRAQEARRARDERRHEQATARARVRTEQLHDRIRVIQARQQIDVDGDLPRSALATLTAGDIESKLARAGNRMDDFLAGGLTRHPLTDQERGQMQFQLVPPPAVTAQLMRQASEQRRQEVERLELREAVEDACARIDTILGRPATRTSGSWCATCRAPIAVTALGCTNCGRDFVRGGYGYGVEHRAAGRRAAGRRCGMCGGTYDPNGFCCAAMFAVRNASALRIECR